jgi:hypothetical protein
MDRKKHHKDGKNWEGVGIFAESMKGTDRLHMPNSRPNGTLTDKEELLDCINGNRRHTITKKNGNMVKLSD